MYSLWSFEVCVHFPCVSRCTICLVETPGSLVLPRCAWTTSGPSNCVGPPRSTCSATADTSSGNTGLQLFLFQQPPPRRDMFYWCTNLLHFLFHLLSASILTLLNRWGIAQEWPIRIKWLVTVLINSIYKQYHLKECGPWNLPSGSWWETWLLCRGIISALHLLPSSVCFL